MKFSHILVLGLIAFIVYRLTLSVQVADPVSREPARGRRVEILQTDGGPVDRIRTESVAGDRVSVDRVSGERVMSEKVSGDGKMSTESALKVILQRLIAAAPARTPPPAELTFDPPPPGQPPVAVSAPAAAAVPLSPRERLRISEARRPALTKEYGPPLSYHGVIRRHLLDGRLLVGSSEGGACVLEDCEPAERQADGTVISFSAWSPGMQSYTDPDGEKRQLRRLIYAAPPLPLWDRYGRPINRDVLPPETVRAAGIHTATMLDKNPKKAE